MVPFCHLLQVDASDLKLLPRLSRSRDDRLPGDCNGLDIHSYSTNMSSESIKALFALFTHKPTSEGDQGDGESMDNSNVFIVHCMLL